LSKIVTKHTEIEAGMAGSEWALVDGMVVRKAASLFRPPPQLGRRCWNIPMAWA
jgi:hypothetical protein